MGERYALLVGDAAAECRNAATGWKIGARAGAMTVTVTDYGAAPIRFSTADFPERERSSAWREFFGREIVKLEIEPLPDRPFRSSAAARVLPGLTLMLG